MAAERQPCCYDGNFFRNFLSFCNTPPTSNIGRLFLVPLTPLRERGYTTEVIESTYAMTVNNLIDMNATKRGSLVWSSQLLAELRRHYERRERKGIWPSSRCNMPIRISIIDNVRSVFLRIDN